jgi:hypothetical protein
MARISTSAAAFLGMYITVIPGAAAAQAASANGTKAAAANTLASVPSADPDSPVSPPSALTISSSDGGTTASISVGYLSNQISGQPGDEIGKFFSAQFVVSTPVGKGSAPAEPLTLKSLPNATSLTANMAMLWVGQLRVDTNDPNYLALCSMESDGFKLSPDAPTKSDPGCGADELVQYAGYQLNSEYKAGMNKDTDPPCATMFQGYATAHNIDGDTAKKDIACTSDNIIKWSGLPEAQKYNAFYQAAKSKISMWKTGLIGKVGYESDRYYLPVALSSGSFQGTPWQLGGYVAYISGNKDYSGVLEYLHQQSYSQQATMTSCLAGAGPTLKCINGPIGVPTTKRSDILSGIFNYQLKTGISAFGGVFSKAAFAPEIDWDFHQRTYGFSLPIFLLGDKTGLNSGVRLDWTSVEHSTTVGVFVTQAFGVVPSPSTQ